MVTVLEREWVAKEGYLLKKRDTNGSTFVNTIMKKNCWRINSLQSIYHSYIGLIQYVVCSLGCSLKVL